MLVNYVVPQINCKKCNLLLAIMQRRMRYVTDYFRTFVLKKVLRYDIFDQRCHKQSNYETRNAQ